LDDFEAFTVTCDNASMIDRLTLEQRSNVMRKVRGKDTIPEMIVRRLTHGAGFRFRLHRKGLPGKPDLCFPAYRKVILTHDGKFDRLPKLYKEARPLAGLPLAHQAALALIPTIVGMRLLRFVGL
jgi:hypothetical protein